MSKPQTVRPEAMCGRSCHCDHGSSLLTRLSLIQGEVLEAIENRGKVSLHHLMEKQHCSPCAVSMAVGELLGQGLVRVSEEGEEVMISTLDPLEFTPLRTMPINRTVKNQGMFVRALRRDVCRHCIEFGEDGLCHSGDPEGCSVYHFLPEIAWICENVQSDKIEDYVQAVRTNICTAKCNHSAPDGSCQLRNRLDCGLDRYLSLVVECIEGLQARLKKHA